MRLLERFLHFAGLIFTLLVATNLRTPYLHAFGEQQLLFLLACCAALFLRSRSWVRRALLAIALIGAAREIDFQLVRARVLAAPPEQLARLGPHVIVGYGDANEVAELVDRRAIGGVYVTRRNVRDKSIDEVRAELTKFRGLYVAADQEGGPIAQLSPPLPRPPPLSALAGDREALREEATRQAIALASLGVNVNFAPVVDLTPQFGPSALDLHTKIAARAISSDPEIVAEVARAYSDALAEQGVIPTLKHFPGLGRVTEDTHHFDGALTASAAELEASDWVPYRSIAPEAFMMIAHVRLAAVDASQPASTSKPVIDGIIRTDWGHDGVLITDDLCMAPVFYAEGGIGGSAVRALNSGIDLLLVSYDEDQYFRVMDALLEADREGKLDRAMLAKSDARLARARPLTRRASSSEIAGCDASSDCS